jgi:hypothetical protein
LADIAGGPARTPGKELHDTRIGDRRTGRRAGELYCALVRDRRGARCAGRAKTDEAGGGVVDRRAARTAAIEEIYRSIVRYRGCASGAVMVKNQTAVFPYRDRGGAGRAVVVEYQFPIGIDRRTARGAAIKKLNCSIGVDRGAAAVDNDSWIEKPESPSGKFGFMARYLQQVA